MRHALVLLAICCTWLACRRPQDDRQSTPAPPPAALLAPVRESMSLDEKLKRLEVELAAFLRSDVEESDAVLRLFRAEAITDRLLEAEPPVRWLASGYDLEARLKQLQALADRVVAQLRREPEREDVRADARALLLDVRALRLALAEGGTEAPLPLDSLLAQYALDSLALVQEGPGGE